MAIVVVMPNTKRHTRYMVTSNHKAFNPQASQRLILLYSCNSFTNGCNPKNIINGNKSKKRATLNISDKIQVATYANAYPMYDFFASGSIRAIHASR